MSPRLALVAILSVACLLVACQPGDGSVDDTAVDGNQTPLGLCINELMPANHGAFPDEEGRYFDWIELHNPTGGMIDLDGWGVSDAADDRFQHTLGPLRLDAGAFLVLYASGDPALGDDHVDFSLARLGEEVVLTHPDGRFVRVVFPEIVRDYAWARTSDCCTGDGCFAAVPIGTPGVTNASAP